MAGVVGSVSWAQRLHSFHGGEEEGEGFKNHHTQQLNSIPLILTGMPKRTGLRLN